MWYYPSSQKKGAGYFIKYPSGYKMYRYPLLRKLVICRLVIWRGTVKFSERKHRKTVEHTKSVERNFLSRLNNSENERTTEDLCPK